jgi:hypothetical protein
MSEETVVTLNVQEDFAEKLASGRPAQAIAELIWNGLDAEATRITVSAEDGELGLQAIVVEDNGHGIPPADAPKLFENLGGSWKKVTRLSKNANRHLHGKEGRGRLRALALGRIAEWFVTAKDESGSLKTFKITIIRDNVKSARISAIEDAPQGAHTGVRVRLSELDKDWRLSSGGVAQELAELYALYMTEYRDVSISLLGDAIDPASVIHLKRQFALPSINRDGQSYPATIEVIEWKSPTERMLYLCDASGLPLHRIPPKIHAPAFEFSAYLKSEYVSLLNQEGKLDVAEMDEELSKALEEGKAQLRTHFKERVLEDTRSRVERWKAESIYPYAGEPDSAVQRVERQVFDIVAINVASAIPEFEALDSRNKRFQLRMLKQAIESSPEDVQLILTEVLELPKQKQEDLAKLLRKTSLSAVISSAKMVADRLEFLRGLETMLFDTDLKKHFKERTQLHRILAENTWLFGEEFALTLSDKSLTEVLRKHLKLKGASTDSVVDAPVKRLDGSTGIVDLFLTRRIPTARADELDYLVVELKRPSVKIGQEETSQIKSYAFAVRNDERFRALKVRWEFWVVSDDLDDYAREEITSSDRPYGMLDRKDNTEIWVKTWSQILNDSKARLQLFQKELNYNADRDDSLSFLQKTYAKILSEGNNPSALPEEDASETSEAADVTEEEIVRTAS